MDRRSPVLDSLTTRLKQRVLAATLLQPHRAWYLQELSRHLKAAPTSVQHELRLFAAAGLLTRKESGNRVYYQADRTCPIFQPLSEMLTRTAGIGDLLKTALAPVTPRLEVVFVYGSIAASEERSSSDIDLMIVGDVRPSEVAPLLRPVEDELGRDVNPTVYTGDEFTKRVRDGNHFLTSLLKTTLLFVHRTADDLAKLTRKSVGEAPPAKRKRTPPASSGRRTRLERR